MEDPLTNIHYPPAARQGPGPPVVIKWGNMQFFTAIQTFEDDVKIFENAIITLLNVCVANSKSLFSKTEVRFQIFVYCGLCQLYHRN